MLFIDQQVHYSEYTPQSNIICRSFGVFIVTERFPFTEYDDFF